MTTQQGAYTATDVSQRYGSTQALSGVSFTVRPGEVHALLGMNGAGKSTLVRVLVGVEQPTAGTLTLGNETLTLASLRDAINKGIAVVAQDLNVFGDLDVLTNLFLLREPRRFGLINHKAMLATAAATLDTVGLHVDPRTPVNELTQSDKQRLAIARATLTRPKVLVLDEPTSALQPREKDRLLQVIRRLRTDGTAIVYVSHFLEEVFSIADRVTVLRDGAVVTPGVPAAETSLPDTVRSMTGAAQQAAAAPPRRPVADVVTESALRVSHLTRQNYFTDITLTARPGEILGVGGLEGSGARSLLSAIFGAEPADSGEVALPSGQRVGRGINSSVRAGIAYLPADRHQSGVMTEASILDNLTTVRVGALGRGGFLLNHRALATRGTARIAELSVKIGSIQDKLSTLSGGNQQKILVGKWLEAEAEVYLLDDPTAAVDVHARTEIHDIIRKLADDGNIVVLTSSDPSELLQLCTRIAVLHQGQLKDILPAADLTAHGLLEAINTGRPATHPREAQDA